MADIEHNGQAGEQQGVSYSGQPASGCEAAIERLKTIPGVGQRVAEVLIAEIGIDMSRFPSSRHLASWAGMAPGNHGSAGRHSSATTRKRNPWLR